MAEIVLPIAAAQFCQPNSSGRPELQQLAAVLVRTVNSYPHTSQTEPNLKPSSSTQM